TLRKLDEERLRHDRPRVDGEDGCNVVERHLARDLVADVHDQKAPLLVQVVGVRRELQDAPAHPGLTGSPRTRPTSSTWTRRAPCSRRRFGLATRYLKGSCLS